ncbi:hypothetical protein FRC10_012232 [Ceratobasidium sp. 414]|nr:hypothetical protein FRC10_012232 [Ceratobasidium sp. 414]
MDDQLGNSDDICRPVLPSLTPTSPPPLIPQTNNLNHTQARPQQPQRVTRAQACRLDVAFRVEHDALPEAPPPLPPPPTSNTSTRPTRQPATTAQAAGRSRDPYHTTPDIFGCYQVYSSQPLAIPSGNAPMAHILPAPNSSHAPHSPWPISDIIAPCPNISVFYVLRYHWLSGNSKSIANCEYLCNEVLLQPNFNPRNLIGINLSNIDSQLAAAARNWDPACPPAEDSYSKITVNYGDSYAKTMADYGIGPELHGSVWILSTQSD